MISDLKITVLRRFHPDDVFGEDYPIKKLDWMSQCHVVEDGQEFIVHEMEMPEGFCSGAWTRARAFGGNMLGTEKGIALGSCNDGLRPVVFKIERN